MNGRTAKQLGRAAASLAVISIAKDAPHLRGAEKVRVLRKTTEKVYNNLKRGWTQTPRKHRAKFRKSLLEATRRTKSALLKGQRQ